jgi:sugar phosphate isomerase/epimerase
VRQYARGVRADLGASELSLGLWLSRASLSAIEHQGTDDLRAALAEAGLFVVTLNGFPYGNFHAEVVKRAVYRPDLTSDARRHYLLVLARVLSQLLPADAAEGTISTLPIGHVDELSAGAVERAAEQLCRLSEQLARLADRTGKPVRICLEPEPGCALETTAQAIHFFTHELPRAAARTGTSASLLATHLGVCYDTCHQAVAFEDAAASIEALVSAGVPIGKAQLSSALELTDPSSEESRAELLTFNEPRFLHQARARRDEDTLAAVDDLPEVAALPQGSPWRVHFHVPIHRALVGRITTTRKFLEDALAAFLRLPRLPQLEVETYTWSVLPAQERPNNAEELVRGLADEIRWAMGVLV